jgi:AcrR family transcriptional regulator
VTARARILQAAERLFAENGIEGVSLRQIAAAAGQRNTSAVSYHYGSKKALVEAVYAWRMAPINVARLEFLRRLGEEGRDGDIGDLVRAFVEPLAATLVDAESKSEAGGEPSFYLRFMAETMRLPEFDPAVVAMERPEGDSVRELIALLRKTVAGHEPPLEVFVERMRLLAILVVSALADRERRGQDPEPPEYLPIIGTEVVVNAGTAILSAPWHG